MKKINQNKSKQKQKT